MKYQNRNFQIRLFPSENCGFLFSYCSLICGLSARCRLLSRTFLVLLLAADCQPVLVLLPGSQPSPDMALGLVYVQYNPCLGSQPRIDVFQPVSYILMYRGFAYSKLLLRLPYRVIVVNDVIGDVYRTLFNILMSLIHI